MVARRGYTREEVLEAIKGTGGVISQIAKKLGTDWHTAQNYINEWESTRLSWLDEKEIIKDRAESNVYQDIWDGNVGTSKWFLTMQAKDRGYGDIENSGDEVQTVDPAKLVQSWMGVNVTARKEDDGDADNSL